MQLAKRKITLGSLFDGIGGFPLAGILSGITPVWASEIEDAPISITKLRFPDMRHLGDITAVNGAEIEPVDVITFGSPCQDLSVAGPRAGLAGSRSGLFMEAVRIIEEMRKATHGKYPAFAVWENVPGALSSNKGEDFRTVIEEIVKIAEPNVSVPRPPRGKWANAGTVLGDGWSIAWRVLDAQYWGVPQRRRRIFLVADFTGERAEEVLFEREGVRGNTSAGRTERQGITSDIETCASGAIAGFNGFRSASGTIEYAEGRSPCITARMPPNVMVSAFMSGQGAKAGGIAYNDNVSPTLKSTASGGNSIPSVLIAPIPIHDKATRYQGGGKERSDDGAGNGLGVGDANDPMCTLDTGCNHAVLTTDRHAAVYPEVARTLTARHDGSPCIDRGQNVVCYGFQSFGQYRESDTAKSLMASDDITTGDLIVHPTVAGTLCASGAGADRPAGQGNELDFVVCAPVALDCRNHRATSISGTLQAKSGSGFSLNYINPVVVNYVVRCLTPLECERLQGFPDEWTAYRDDAKPISDSARYRAIGNSVAIPCVRFVMQGIAERLWMEV